jgi:hypothetical protein
VFIAGLMFGSFAVRFLFQGRKSLIVGCEGCHREDGGVRGEGPQCRQAINEKTLVEIQ